MDNLRKLAFAYFVAKEAVIASGYSHDLDWQDDISVDYLTENIFIHEAAWVILSSGMSEKVIRRKFSDFSAAFFNWESSEKIVINMEQCRAKALDVFGNVRKIDSIIRIAEHVYEKSFCNVINLLYEEGLEYISELPYMGPATSYHFAKNIGMPVVKPDRHLLRVAQNLNYSTPHELCADISQITDEKLEIIDIVIWRYATLEKNYLELFQAH